MDFSDGNRRRVTFIEDLPSVSELESSAAVRTSIRSDTLPYKSYSSPLVENFSPASAAPAPAPGLGVGGAGGGNMLPPPPPLSAKVAMIQASRSAGGEYPEPRNPVPTSLVRPAPPPAPREYYDPQVHVHPASYRDNDSVSDDRRRRDVDREIHDLKTELNRLKDDLSHAHAREHALAREQERERERDREREHALAHAHAHAHTHTGQGQASCWKCARSKNKDFVIAILALGCVLLILYIMYDKRVAFV